MKWDENWRKDEFEAALNEARTYVPELEGVEIHQNIRYLSTVPSLILPALMNTVPNIPKLIASEFKGKEAREYTINQNRGKRNDKIFGDLSYDSLVFWTTHELIHVLEYENQSLADLGKFALTYIPKYLANNPDIKNTERRVNLEVISRGLAPHFLKLGQELMASEHIPDFYKDKLKAAYVPAWEQLEPFAEKQGINKQVYGAIMEK